MSGSSASIGVSSPFDVMVNTAERPYTSVLVTGAGGYIGRQLVDQLAAYGAPEPIATHRGADVLKVCRPQVIVASDIRVPNERHAGVNYVEADVRSTDFVELFRRYATDVVVHLAAIVTPGPQSNRELEYAVDVTGTERVLQACVAAGVRKIIYTSSGAAYGYHADNPAWLDESDALRGNPEFAYSDHKRLVEEMLARWRRDHPALLQLIFRPGTILGATTQNQITDLFEQRYLLGIKGSESPFVIIWDRDLVAAILQGIQSGGTGIFNVAGDGAISLREMAVMLGKPYVALPAGLVGAALRILKPLGLTQYGPEQVDFLRYRPVLSNRRLKEEFGYVPRKTSREVFRLFLDSRGSRT